MRDGAHWRHLIHTPAAAGLAAAQRAECTANVEGTAHSSVVLLWPTSCLLSGISGFSCVCGAAPSALTMSRYKLSASKRRACRAGQAR